MAKLRRQSDPDLPAHPSADDAAQRTGDVQNASNDERENAPRDRIAARAYELYLERGASHGQDWEDWLAAEREIRGPRTNRNE